MQYAQIPSSGPNEEVDSSTSHFEPFSVHHPATAAGPKLRPALPLIPDLPHYKPCLLEPSLKSQSHRNCDWRLRFCAWRAGSEEGSRGRCRRFWHRCSRRQCPHLALGRLIAAPGQVVVYVPPLANRGPMADAQQQKARSNRVFKSLHKPLTYLGVERTLFYLVCVAARRRLQSLLLLLAGSAVFVGGYAFGHWVTNSDPAFLRILAKARALQTSLRRCQAASPACGGPLNVTMRRSSSRGKRPPRSMTISTSDGLLELDDLFNQEWRRWYGSGRARRRLRKPRPCSPGVCGQAAGSGPQSLWPRLPCLSVSFQIELPPQDRSPTTTTRLWRPPSSSVGSSLRLTRITCTRSKSSMPSCWRVWVWADEEPVGLQ